MSILHFPTNTIFYYIPHEKYSEELIMTKDLRLMERYKEPHRFYHRSPMLSVIYTGLPFSDLQAYD